MPDLVVCPGCGAEIDPETGKATYDGQPVEGDAALRTRLEELEQENLELRETIDRREADGAADDDAARGENPFFH